MSDTTALERSYRRILACYPRSFLRENADEVLAVLLDTAAEGQTRVRLAEAGDLVRGGVRMRPDHPGPAAPVTAEPVGDRPGSQAWARSSTISRS
jgi:hypothetical protein